MKSTYAMHHITPRGSISAMNGISAINIYSTMHHSISAMKNFDAKNSIPATTTFALITISAVESIFQDKILVHNIPARDKISAIQYPNCQSLLSA
jgi:hypothetical protein